ncbi:2-hydroxyacid dehydrogenase [Rhodoplanes sp. SY1]|uniref:2-hydroxyacid dehydrogenase n=1 Tax=Rhodoplanes sp. SY1 TaxID=3166646 RepID=UPI0038B65C5C
MATDTAGDTPNVLLVGTAKPIVVGGLDPIVRLHRLIEAPDRERFLADVAGRVRALAVTHSGNKIDPAFLQRFPKLEIVSSVGVGYDHIDAAWAGQNGIVVTNTPEVLDEEVADTALGLLLSTVRELPQAERYLRAGKWAEAPFPLSRATLRNRTVGLVGMGRIGRAIARRLDAFGVPVVYHTRRHNPAVPYRHYPALIDMARDVDTLMLILPGGPATRNLIDATVLKALGPDGIVINMARGSVVDEPALIQALKERTIFAAGLDVFVNEPHVPPELIALENVVLLPHLGSASVHTRARMDQLVVDNLACWFAGKGPVTPVPETPWPLAR